MCIFTTPLIIMEFYLIIIYFLFHYQHIPKVNERIKIVDRIPTTIILTNIGIRLYPSRQLQPEPRTHRHGEWKMRIQLQRHNFFYRYISKFAALSPSSLHYPTIKLILTTATHPPHNHYHISNSSHHFQHHFFANENSQQGFLRRCHLQKERPP